MPKRVISTAAAMAVAVLALWVQPAAAATIHVNCNTQNLQTKIKHASPGSTLLIKGTCLGTFKVGKTLTLKGNPTATLDGNDAGSTLTTTGQPKVHLIRLVITGGLAPTGGGVDAEGGILRLDRVTVEDNLATGPTAQGGGIFAPSTVRLTVTDSAVKHNVAFASASGTASAAGGGISSGEITLVGSAVSSNAAVARSSGADAHADGGGLQVVGTPVTVHSTHFDGNRVAADGDTTSKAVGGGMQLTTGEPMSVSKSTFNGNVLTATGSPATAQGGGAEAEIGNGSISGSSFAGNRLAASSSGGDATAEGGGLDLQLDSKVAVTGSRFTGSRLSASGGNSASGLGGGLRQASTGPLSLSKSTVDGNRVSVTANGAGAHVEGGGIDTTSDISLKASTVSRNVLLATIYDPDLATGEGGGIDLGSGSSDKFTNSTIAENAVKTQIVGGGGDAISVGGGIYTAVMTTFVNSTVGRNAADAKGDSPFANGGGLYVNSETTTIQATLIALNTAPGLGPDCRGTVHSQGHNLIGDTTDCNFTPKGNDKHDVNPKLAKLAPNGGPTQTVALLKGSPAIDWIPKKSCAVTTDQRGVSRPQGPRCDIGAYERKV